MNGSSWHTAEGVLSVGHDVTTEETDCPNSRDDVPLHCEHWYDCEPCCWCHDDPPHDPECEPCDNPAHFPP